MKNRLESAWDLLDEHGIITISLDDNENHYLKVLLDEIFKPENFIGNLVRQTRKGGGSMSKFISVDHDYILVYAKKKKNLDRIYTKHTEEYLKRYNEIDETGRFFWDTYVRNRQGTANFYEIKAPDGSKLKNAWLNPEKTFKKLINDGEVRFVKKDDGSWSVQVKQRLNKEGQILRSLITDFPNEQGTSEIKEIFNSLSFSYPKPKNLIKKLIEIFSDSNDVVLDFFAGSGTTGHAVLELNKEDGGNRKFILIEQLDEHINVCKKRISAVGGDFACLELASWNEKWIENIKKAKTGKELEKIWDELKKSAFLSYKIEPEKVDKYKKEFSELSLAQQKDFLQKECLDQNHLYINYSEINDEEYKVSAEDKKINKEFYGK